ncbi:MAG: hypothetical protein R2857_15540 [Vampirovibrionales bacterium]
MLTAVSNNRNNWGNDAMTRPDIWQISANRTEIGEVISQLQNDPNIDVDGESYLNFLCALYDSGNYNEITTDDGSLVYINRRP